MKSLEKSVKDKIASRILYLIGQNDVTEFARSIGVSRNNVNDWIRGKADIRIGDVIEISKKYGKSVDWILGLVPKEKDSNVQEVQVASDYTGLNHEAIEMLHLHNAKKAFQDRIEGLNFLLCNIMFYKDCLPGIDRVIRLSDKISNYEFSDNIGVISESGEITLDPEKAARYYTQDVAYNLQYLLDFFIASIADDNAIGGAAKDLIKGQEEIYLERLMSKPHPVEDTIDDIELIEAAEEFDEITQLHDALEKENSLYKKVLENLKEGDQGSKK